jgi:HTH-type transcriptional regulator/antitoxin HigA
MKAVVATMVQEAAEHWAYVAPVLKTPESEEDFEYLVAALDEVLDAGGADESHDLASLAERMGDLVAAYEAAHVPELNIADGVDLLVYLMEDHGLRQADLPEIGNQSVVSLVLSRKRRLNADQLYNLSQRFGLPMDAFVTTQHRRQRP